MDPGKRDQMIVIERGTAITDDHGGETIAWDEFTRAWARIKYGTGQERRQAAQELAVQAATFECEWTPTLAAVVTKDRILLGAEAWDIVSNAPLSHKEIHLTAVRSE